MAGTTLLPQSARTRCGRARRLSRRNDPRTTAMAPAAILESGCPHRPEGLGFRAALPATLEMPQSFRRQRLRGLDQIDELGAAQVLHDFEFSSFFKFASAWKKFAFTAPTDVPTMRAISSCGRS